MYKISDFAGRQTDAVVQKAEVRTLQQVLDNVEKQHELVVDARAAARFQAKAPEPRPGMRGGHIPHSKNVPFDSLLSNGRWAPYVLRPSLRQHEPFDLFPSICKCTCHSVCT